MSSRASIVIPAYNEESRIRGLLATLADPSIRDAYDVYVVCNGCTDRTRQVAEEYAGVAVAEIESVGKYLALNEGDRLAGDVFPRLYCDADIRLSPSSITALVEALTTEEVKVAAPTVRYAVEKSTTMLKVYYRAVALPIIARWNSGLPIGRGLYGASRAARQRFDSFPALVADDLFFDSQFDATEKLILPDAVVEAWVPANLRQLINGEVRVAAGNRQYRVAGNDPEDAARHAMVGHDRPASTLGDRFAALWGWRHELRGGDVVPVLLYIVIRATARTILAIKRVRGREISWR